MRPGWRRIGVTSEAPGLTVSAFQGPSPDALVLVGVKEGGPNHFEVDCRRLLDQRLPSWDLYETTRELDCQKVGTAPVRNGLAEIDLPGEAVFTLVANPGKPD